MQTFNGFLQISHSPGKGLGSSVGCAVVGGAVVGCAVVGWSPVGWFTKYRTIKAMLTPVIATKRNISIFSRVLILLDRRESLDDSISPQLQRRCTVLRLLRLLPKVAAFFSSQAGVNELYTFFFSRVPSISKVQSRRCKYGTIIKAS